MFGRLYNLLEVFSLERLVVNVLDVLHLQVLLENGHHKRRNDYEFGMFDLEVRLTAHVVNHLSKLLNYLEAVHARHLVVQNYQFDRLDTHLYN